VRLGGIVISIGFVVFCLASGAWMTLCRRDGIERMVQAPVAAPGASMPRDFWLESGPFDASLTRPKEIFFTLSVAGLVAFFWGIHVKNSGPSR
jgi:hypothetical protein